MTSIEVPYSIAAALPSLAVMDITNDVSREVAASGVQSGIAYLHAAHGLSLVRVQERETGFFEDLESAFGVGALLRRRALPRAVAADPPLLARRGAPSRLVAHARRLTFRIRRPVPATARLCDGRLRQNEAEAADLPRPRVTDS
jgi:hypothetical protein